MTPYQPRDYPTRIYHLYKRLGQNIFSTDEESGKLLAGRLDAWKKGWQLFLRHPIVGVGSGNFTEYGDKAITHAHNMLIHVLATQGIAGFSMWLAVGGLMFSIMSRRQKIDFLPMIILILMMNMTDYTFVHASSLYIFFFSWCCVYFNKIYPESQ